jgi:hypothetical protein
MSLFLCKNCNKTFNRKSNYIRHLNRKNPCKSDLPVFINVIDNNGLSYKVLKTQNKKMLKNKNNLKIDGSPLKIDGSPLKIDGSPLKIDGSSLKIDGSSLKIDGSSLKIDGSPLKIDGSTLKIDGSSVNIDKSKTKLGEKNDIFCNFCNKKFKKKSYLDVHIKKYCKIKIEFNNIYKFNKSTFGKNLYGENGGDIYIVQTDHNFNNIFKIGKTTNIYNRLNDYRCGSDIEPRLYYYYPFSDIKLADILLKNSLEKYNIKRKIYESNLENFRKEILNLQKKLDSKQIENEPIIKRTDLSECLSCNKLFYKKNDMFNHIKKCEVYRKKYFKCKKILEQKKDNNKIKIFESPEDKIKDLLKELEEAKKKIEELSKSQNVTYNTNNITLIAYNKQPDLSHLTNRDYLRIMNKGFKSVPKLIEEIHFNPNKPENQNIYIPNIKNNYAMVWNGKKWDLTNRKEIIEDMYDNNSNILIEKMEEMDGNNIKDSIKRKFKRFIEKKEDDKIKNRIKDEIKLLLYNNKEVTVK